MTTKCAAGLERCTPRDYIEDRCVLKKRPGGYPDWLPHHTDGSPCTHGPAREGKERREGARRIVSSRVSGDTVYLPGKLSKMQERTGDDRRKWDGKTEKPKPSADATLPARLRADAFDLTQLVPLTHPGWQPTLNVIAKNLREAAARIESLLKERAVCHGTVDAEIDGVKQPGTIFDGTDGACPGWWRGQEYGYKAGAVELAPASEERVIHPNRHPPSAVPAPSPSDARVEEIQCAEPEQDNEEPWRGKTARCLKCPGCLRYEIRRLESVNQSYGESALQLSIKVHAQAAAHEKREQELYMAYRSAVTYGNGVQSRMFEAEAKLKIAVEALKLARCHHARGQDDQLWESLTEAIAAMEEGK